MPSFRIIPNDDVTDDRATFKGDLAKYKVLFHTRTALMKLKQSIMDGNVPSDPMTFLLQELGVELVSSDEIEEMKKKIQNVYSKIEKYEPKKTPVNESDKLSAETSMKTPFWNDSSDENKDEISSLNLEPTKAGNNFKFYNGDSFSMDDSEKSDEEDEAFNMDDNPNEAKSSTLDRSANEIGAGASLECNLKPKDMDRAPIIGCQVMESKREACRKILESKGILLFLERAFASLFDFKHLSDPDPMKSYLNYLREHSKGFQDLEALKTFYAIGKKRLQFLKEAKEKN